MRPTILNPLFAAATTLDGVGKKIAQNLTGLVAPRDREPRIIDLLTHMPYAVTDRSAMPDLISAPDGEVISVIVEIEEYRSPPPHSGRPFRVICHNDTGYLTVVFFNMKPDYIRRELPVGQKRLVSGKVERFDEVLQMIHPDHIALPDRLDEICRTEPVYPLTQGISQKMMNRIIGQAVAVMRKMPEWPEWIDPQFMVRQGWESWKAAMDKLHNPDSAADVAPESKVRMRLAYDELLANQLALALTRRNVKKKAGRSVRGDGRMRSRLADALPFSLTKGQQQVISEILEDMADKHRMLRMLQGDVGSGKTVVALMAMLNAVEEDKQAVLMAPTEILARQHAAWISRIINESGLDGEVRVSLLTGRDKGKNREEILHSLENGEIHIIIGTHALFQASVKFHDLALVVIDEQHRFGVKQRLSLAAKGQNTDILLMTATPIPRTLSLTFYGDIDISSLREKPAGRRPIDTRIIPESRIGDIVEGLKRAIAAGNRVYWVCPLIEESENIDLAAAEDRHRHLQQILGGQQQNRVGLVHGQMKPEEKDVVMSAFKQGELDVLVATTVIEVGVDVPEATVIVIEHAERFGLAQLHQLRGRVGRHDKPSSCILLYDNKISDIGKRRLKIMRETEDGFRIAEEDLLLRGSGEVLGTKQSGMPDFKLAVLPEHSELLLAARDDTKMIIETDPELKSERSTALRTLLYLFEYDSQIKYLLSG